MKYLTGILIALVMIIGLVTFYYHGKATESEEKNAELLKELGKLAKEFEKFDREKSDITANLKVKDQKIQEKEKQIQVKESKLKELADAYENLKKELKQEIEQKKVKLLKVDDQVTVTFVDKVLFPSGEAELNDEGLKVMRRVGEILKGVDSHLIRVEGHTDNVPIKYELSRRFPTNWELSSARSLNVLRFLQEQVEINPILLQAVAFSEFHPVADNSTPEGRAQNRRIEILLVPMKKIPAPKEEAKTGVKVPEDTAAKPVVERKVPEPEVDTTK